MATIPSSTRGKRSDTSIVLVSRPGDEHGDVVERELRARGAAVQRISLNVWQTLGLKWLPGGPLETHDGIVDSNSVIWWRRPGWLDTRAMERDEADLARGEATALLFGLLAAPQPRWVDPPLYVVRAESKPLQLATAQNLGVPHPRTLVTSVEEQAREFARFGPFVAKSVSSGRGLAPFVDEIRTDLLRLVPGSPVLLQERIDALADLRVVTVGNQTLTWERTKLHGEPIDWRQVDPAGSGFEPTTTPTSLAVQAVAMAAAFGLSFSVQDWLRTDDGPVFLETNPGGQWLFLSEADSLVGSLLVDHLLRQ